MILGRMKEMVIVEFPYQPAIYLLNFTKSYICSYYIESALYILTASRILYCKGHYYKGYVNPSLEKQLTKLLGICINVQNNFIT